MIVDPDFLDHWRTRMLVDALGGDEMAPMYLIRLWAHCQVRHSDRFEMPPAGLKAQCRYAGDAEAFEKALADGKFIERHESDIAVLGWAEQNAALLAAWDNGNKGGRPKKPKTNPGVSDAGLNGHSGNQEETHGFAIETHGEPNANPSETQTKPIREEKSREEKNSPSPNGEGSGPAPCAAPPPPPAFDGKNSKALNGKAIVQIAVDWELPEEWGLDAESLGWKPSQVLYQAEKYRQYWTVGKGQGTRRSVKGWRQSWSNWLERAAKDQR